MNQPALAITVAALLFMALMAYAVFAGADLGGGIWDLLAGSAERGERPRALIDANITPVWEANHVWLIYVLVLLWTGFPPAFAAIMTTMFVPLSLTLLGIVLRGVGFAFRHEARHLRTKQLTGALFAASSLMTPFFFGTVVGAIVTGEIRAGQQGNAFAAWTSLTSLLIGAAFAVACAYLAAVYLIADARKRGQSDMVAYFRRRGVAAGGLAGLLIVAVFASLHSAGRYVFDNLLGRALPVVAVSVAAGIVALVMLVTGRVRGLRVVAAFAVVTAIASWATAQYPYLLPTTLSLRDGAAPSPSLIVELVVLGMVGLFVAPGLLILYVLQQRGALGETDTSESLRRAVAAEEEPAAPSPPPVPTTAERIVTGAAIGVAAGELLAQSVRLLRRRWNRSR